MSQEHQATSTRHPGAGPDLQAIRTYIEKGLAVYGVDPRAARFLQRLASHYPDLFFTEAVRYLESNTDPRAERALAGLLIRQESFFARLTNPSGRSLESAVRLFRCLLRADPMLDLKLARMLSGRNDVDPDNVLTKENAARAIDILEQTSRGPRLFSVLGHLTTSADAKISAKAALFVGRRMDNPNWTAKQLLSENDRVRANALEAFWGSASHASLRILRECVSDGNNRVAGNALVGLHVAGHPGAEEVAISMSFAEDPGRRATAAWAMGRIGMPTFTRRLLELLGDESPNVRSAASKALARIESIEKPLLNSTAADSIEIEESPEIPVSSVVDVGVEIDSSQASPEPLDDTSILKLNR